MDGGSVEEVEDVVGVCEGDFAWGEDGGEGLVELGVEGGGAGQEGEVGRAVFVGC